MSSRAAHVGFLPCFDTGNESCHELNVHLDGAHLQCKLSEGREMMLYRGSSAGGGRRRNRNSVFVSASW